MLGTFYWNIKFPSQTEADFRIIVQNVRRSSANPGNFLLLMVWSEFSLVDERREYRSTSQILFKENSILKKSMQGGGKEWD